MNKLSLEAAAGVYSGTAHDAKPHPMHIERNNAFKAGAEWQRNHVWHKNTEFPSRGIHGSGWGEQCLVKIKDEHQNIPIVAQADLANGYFYFCDNRGVWITMSNVDCWAYLDDLMPTSFDDIIEENKDVLQRLKDLQYEKIHWNKTD